MDWMGFPLAVWLVLFAILVFVSMLSRLGGEKRCEGECQFAFFLVMVLVGLMTIFSLRIGSGDWLIGCLAMAAIVVSSSLSGSLENGDALL